MNNTRSIFNSNGDYVAFIQDNNIFSIQGIWIGFIRNGNEAYNNQGTFVGYVSADDRIISNTIEPIRPRIIPPIPPIRPLIPIAPLRRLKMQELPQPWRDVFMK